MKTMYDVRSLLKKYGIFVYTGSRQGDIDLMENEVRDLYNSKLIQITDFQVAMLLLRKERARLNK